MNNNLQSNCVRNYLDRPAANVLFKNYAPEKLSAKCFILANCSIHLLMKEEKEKLRLDKYLWSIRLFKTRALASEACEKGRVKLNDTPVKASRNVNIGDKYAVKTGDRKWLVQVTGLLDHRVQYSEAVKYYVDLTPEEEKEKMQAQAASFYTGKRLSKTGRPTKKQRRNLDEFTGDL